MSALSSRMFLAGLAFVFIGAVIADVALGAMGTDRELARIIIYILSAACLTYLLSIRLRQIHLPRVWAVLGLLPPLGIMFGIYLFMKESG